MYRIQEFENRVTLNNEIQPRRAPISRRNLRSIFLINLFKFAYRITPFNKIISNGHLSTGLS